MPVVERIGAGRPVLLIHGSPGDRGTWARVAARTPAGFASWLLELPGHGRQPLDACSLGGFLDDLRAAVDEADEPVVLAGLSVGGYLALRFARDNPERVARVVGCAAFGSIDADGIAFRRQFAAAMRSGAETPASAFSQWLDPLVAPAERSEEIEKVLRRSMADETPERLARIAEAAAEIGEPGAAVASIHVPLTLLHGRHDPLLPFATAEALQAAGEHVVLEALETSSHVLTLSHPEVVARWVYQQRQPQ